jgi:CTD kinase subunit gamma
MEFTEMVRKLTASQQSILKACSFALKYRELHEILYDIVYDQLNSASINARLNIFYLVDAICQSSRKINFNGYQVLFERDLLAIVRLCVPADPTGAINLASVTKVEAFLMRFKYI